MINVRKLKECMIKKDRRVKKKERRGEKIRKV